MTAIAEPHDIVARGSTDRGVADEEMEELAINTIRTLCIDAVQEANSGHPGTPMALAPVAYCLWQRFLRFDPEHAEIWLNEHSLVAGVKMLLGKDPKQEYQDKVAQVDLRH